MSRRGLADAALANAIGSQVRSLHTYHIRCVVIVVTSVGRTQVINVTLGVGLPLLFSCLMARGGSVGVANEVSRRVDPSFH